MKRLLLARYCWTVIVIADFPIPENRSVRKANELSSSRGVHTRDFLLVTFAHGRKPACNRPYFILNWILFKAHLNVLNSIIKVYDFSVVLYLYKLKQQTVGTHIDTFMNIV